MKVSFLGHSFPWWPPRLGKRRWKMQWNMTAAQLRKTRESATTAFNPRWEGKCQQYTNAMEGGRREGVGGGEGNSITSASSFAGHGERDRNRELWTTNEISKSWVRLWSPVSLSARQHKGETRKWTRVRANKTAPKLNMTELLVKIMCNHWNSNYSVASAMIVQKVTSIFPCNFTPVPTSWQGHAWLHTHTHIYKIYSIESSQPYPSSRQFIQSSTLPWSFSLGLICRLQSSWLQMQQNDNTDGHRTHHWQFRQM